MQLRLPESDIEEMDDDDVQELDTEERSQTQGEKHRLKNHRLPLTCLCIDSKNEHAFTGSKDGSIIKWCLKTKKILHKIHPIKKKLAEKSDEEVKKRNHHNHINCIAISSDDKFLATGGGDPNIRIWSPEDMTWLHSFGLHRKEVTALAFRKGQHMLYSGSADRAVMIWTLEDDDNRVFVEALYGHESAITSMDTLYKERVLTSGGRDQSIRIWKIVEQAQTVFQSKHESVDITRYIDDKTFVSGGEDGNITVWTTMKRSPLCTMPKAHGSSTDSKTTNGDCPFSQKLSYWITSLAVFQMKPIKKQADDNPNKKRRLNEDLEGVTGNDIDDEENSDQSDDDDNQDKNKGNQGESSSLASECIALVASGSCDSLLNIWKLTKNQGKHELVKHQAIECPGFINDLRFTSDGSKVLAACGQEHRLGRWWKIKGTKNCLRVLNVNKI